METNPPRFLHQLNFFFVSLSSFFSTPLFQFTLESLSRLSISCAEQCLILGFLDFRVLFDYGG